MLLHSIPNQIRKFQQRTYVHLQEKRIEINIIKNFVVIKITNIIQTED